MKALKSGSDLTFEQIFRRLLYFGADIDVVNTFSRCPKCNYNANSSANSNKVCSLLHGNPLYGL